MHKRFSISVITLLLSISVSAKHIPAETAKIIAANFISQTSPSFKSNSSTLELSHVEYLKDQGLRNNSKSIGYYVYNITNNGGFVIISGDDRAYPILGYSTSGNFQPNETPDNMRSWLASYGQEVSFLIENNIPAAEESLKLWKELSSGPKQITYPGLVELKTARWHQSAPYNKFCPILRGDTCITGCVATAIGIVMRHYRWPQKGTGHYSYTTSTHKIYVTADFNVTYDWDNMLDFYPTYGATEKEIDAVATLLFHCGVAVNMDYGPTLSGTNVSMSSLRRFFDYHPAARYVSRLFYSDDEWITLVQSQLDNNHPILYSGSNDRDGGHQFVIDGYNKNNNFVRINWGWGAISGYYSLSAYKPTKSYITYPNNQYMSVDFIPSNIILEEKNELRLINGGLKANIEKITPGANFILTVTSVFNDGNTSFNGYIGVALVSEKNEIKKILYKYKRGISLAPGGHTNFNFEHTMDEDFESTDKICGVYSLDGDNWTLMSASPTIPSEIPLYKTPVSNENMVEEESLQAYFYERTIYITNAPVNSNLSIYTTSGKMIAHTKYTGQTIAIQTPGTGVYFIKGEKETIAITGK